MRRRYAGRMMMFLRFGRAARSAPLSATFVALATLTGASLYSYSDLQWVNWSSGYLLIAKDVAMGALPPLLSGTVIVLVAHRVRVFFFPEKPVAPVGAYVAVAAAALVFATFITILSQIATGMLFTF